MRCSSDVGTGKVQIGATFTLAGVASLSQSLRVSCLDLSSAWRATFKRNNLSHAGEKMLVWIIARMERRASRSVYEKKKRKEKVRVPEVVFEPCASVHRSVDGWAMYRHWSTERSPGDKSRSKPNKHTIYRTDTGIKLEFIIFFYSPPGSLQKKINK